MLYVFSRMPNDHAMGRSCSMGRELESAKLLDGEFKFVRNFDLEIRELFVAVTAYYVQKSRL